MQIKESYTGNGRDFQIPAGRYLKVREWMQIEPLGMMCRLCTKEYH